MNKKKIIILAIIIVVFALLFGIYRIYENYQLGNEILKESQIMSVNSGRLARSIDFLEKEFKKADIDHTNVTRYEYDFAIGTAIEGFNHMDTLLLFDVSIQWRYELENLYYRKTQIGVDMEDYFGSEKGANEIAKLRSQLENMTYTLMDFRERYNQMSFWERCFTSWSNEREALSDQVRISN